MCGSGGAADWGASPWPHWERFSNNRNTNTHPTKWERAFFFLSFNFPFLSFPSFLSNSYGSNGNRKLEGGKCHRQWKCFQASGEGGGVLQRRGARQGEQTPTVREHPTHKQPSSSAPAGTSPSSFFGEAAVFRRLLAAASCEAAGRLRHPGGRESWREGQQQQYKRGRPTQLTRRFLGCCSTRPLHDLWQAANLSFVDGRARECACISGCARI